MLQLSFVYKFQHLPLFLNFIPILVCWTLLGHDSCRILLELMLGSPPWCCNYKIIFWGQTPLQHGLDTGQENEPTPTPGWTLIRHWFLLWDFFFVNIALWNESALYSFCKLHYHMKIINFNNFVLEGEYINLNNQFKFLKCWFIYIYIICSVPMISFHSC